MAGGSRRGSQRLVERARPWRSEHERAPTCSARIPAPATGGTRRPRRRLGRSTALVYRSNLLGADRALANIGGGNTSAKETTVDHAGREMRVLWVKGSGTDLATITAAGFAGASAR